MNERQETLEILFERHRDLADRAAASVWRKTPHLNGLDQDDYRQLALLGLLDAIKRFKPSEGYKFEAYAWKRIVGTIRSGIREADEVKRTQRSAGIKGPTIRLDHTTIANDGERAMLLRDLLAASDSPSRADSFDEVRHVLDGLPLESRVVMYLSCVDGLSLWQIACVLGRREQTVSEIRSAAMEYLQRCHMQPTKRDKQLMNQPSLFS